jgi:pyridoxamine 5'-phosphate oxidase
MDNLINYFLNPDPIGSFEEWYASAKMIEQNPEAMTLSTLDLKHNRPDSRTVLFKGMKDGNLTFYTNYNSAKSKELNEHNEACVLFYWHESKRQVRIQGRVTKMAATDSDKYFNGRDRQSQLASYISEQSSPIENKDALMKKLAEASELFKGMNVPRPENWGGFLFEPYEFEFFLYGDFRINDRFLFKKDHNDWMITRLQP